MGSTLECPLGYLISKCIARSERKVPASERKLNCRKTSPEVRFVWIDNSRVGSLVDKFVLINRLERLARFVTSGVSSSPSNYKPYRKTDKRDD